MSPTSRRWHEASAASIAASQGCSREGFRGRWTQAAAEIGSSGVAPARGGREAGREEAWRGQTVCWHAQGGIAAGVEQTRAHGGRVIYGLVGMREGAGGAGRRTGELGAFVRHGACPVLPQVVLPENRAHGARERRVEWRSQRLDIVSLGLPVRISPRI